jgi:hypothetical protein
MNFFTRTYCFSYVFNLHSPSVFLKIQMAFYKMAKIRRNQPNVRIHIVDSTKSYSQQSVIFLSKTSRWFHILIFVYEFWFRMLLLISGPPFSNIFHNFLSFSFKNSGQSLSVFSRNICSLNNNKIIIFFPLSTIKEIKLIKAWIENIISLQQNYLVYTQIIIINNENVKTPAYTVHTRI